MLRLKMLAMFEVKVTFFQAVDQVSSTFDGISWGRMSHSG